MTELQKRFPEDLAWKVTYDPTAFVKDTIHEVQKTLIEAFVLVVHRRLSCSSAASARR